MTIWPQNARAYGKEGLGNKEILAGANTIARTADGDVLQRLTSGSSPAGQLEATIETQKNFPLAACGAPQSAGPGQFREEMDALSRHSSPSSQEYCWTYE